MINLSIYKSFCRTVARWKTELECSVHYGNFHIKMIKQNSSESTQYTNNPPFSGGRRGSSTGKNFVISKMTRGLK